MEHRTTTTAATTIFLAGATGAIGRPLCRLLVADGHRVVGTTRSAGKAEVLRAMGVEPVVVDVFDEVKLRDAVAAAGPGVVIHQLTDLPAGLDPAEMEQARVRNAYLREVGTRHLVAAAVAAGARRIIAQSIAFAYANNLLPHRESDPLADDVTARAVGSLERQVLAAPMDAVVLRYGKLFGPGTGFDAPHSDMPLHVDAAADAARRAVTRGRGVYHIAEDDGTLTLDRAAAELGWRSDFRIGGK